LTLPLFHDLLIVDGGLQLAQPLKKLSMMDKFTLVFLVYALDVIGELPIDYFKLVGGGIVRIGSLHDSIHLLK
jgi:hypothetical protein